MKLNILASSIGAKPLTESAIGDAEIDSVYAGDRMSDLLTHASSRTLLVTGLVGPQLLRLAELMDVQAICLVDGASVEPETADQAGARGTILLLSPVGMFETCGRLYACLKGGNEPGK
ncbi:MAG: hypothetical protein AB1696_06330 [Planctomycetota bacterium]